MQGKKDDLLQRTRKEKQEKAQEQPRRESRLCVELKQRTRSGEVLEICLYLTKEEMKGLNQWMGIYRWSY